MTSDEGPRTPAPKGGFRPRMILVPAAGVLLLIAGTLLVALGPGTGNINFGWVVTDSLSDDEFSSLVLVSGRMLIGALLVLAGAVLIAFWGGLQAGRRRRRPQAPPTASA